MNKLNVKKGDTVVVISGKDKGKQGKIIKIDVVKARAIVGGVNMVKKAMKPNPQTGEGGGIVAKEASLHASNVMLVDPKTQKPTRKRPE